MVDLPHELAPALPADEPPGAGRLGTSRPRVPVLVSRLSRIVETISPNVGTRMVPRVFHAWSSLTPAASCMFMMARYWG